MIISWDGLDQFTPESHLCLKQSEPATTSQWCCCSQINWRERFPQLLNYSFIDIKTNLPNFVLEYSSRVKKKKGEKKTGELLLWCRQSKEENSDQSTLNVCRHGAGAEWVDGEIRPEAEKNTEMTRPVQKNKTFLPTWKKDVMPPQKPKE